jgi:DNA-binding FrmR family transcriptional regulator
MEEDKKLILHRLRRIAGQVRGVEKMIEEGRPCQDVIHQLIAVKNAVNQACTKILVQESCKIDSKQNGKELESLIKNLVGLSD